MNKRTIVLNLFVVIAMLLATLPVNAIQPESVEVPPPPPTSAATIKVLDKPLTLPPLPQRALPGKSEGAPAPKKTITQANWTLGPDLSSCFDWTRFDAEYFPATGKVYILGGRSGANTDGTIKVFDPVAGTCQNTGATMPTPISNYSISLVNNGTADVLCTFGGRDASGAQTLNVQCYNPISNTVSIVTQLPAAYTGYMPGAQVVYNNQVYIFGGFRNTATPYHLVRTDRYDPVSNTFTQLGDLTLGRGYITAAVVDGKIYAFGGDVYDGTNLVAQTIAEVMADPEGAGTWSDVAVADLPTASGEGRAFGFDSNAPYEFANKIVLVGGGQWPNNTAEALIYDVANDSYDTAFPDLNVARRNHAAAFVPLDSPDPADGLPGMWVFGGRATSDNPPYAQTEFYPMMTRSCNVLVVDDDWDFDSVVPNDGGRPYYTSTLDFLGFDYDVWDTVSQGNPTTADMASYDVVIWFTGYAWQSGVFTPDNENQVAAYLNNGGNFILSSADYHYEAGTITPFMQNYLGVSSINDDVVELDPVGNAGTIGAGLGPYAMARPDDWAAYWPTGSYEGPYDDYANAGPGADEPFRYLTSGENNSTSYDAGTFKTVFLAWPFEWIDTVNERAEILGAMLNWMCVPAGTPEVRLLPPYQEGFADPGTTAAYTLTLTNLLGHDDTFTLTYASAWGVNAPTSVVVSNGASLDFQVVVTVPADAECLDEDTLVVTALDSTATYSDTSQIRTVAGPAWQVESNTGATGAHWMAFACTDDYGAAGTCFYAGGLGAGNAVTNRAQMYDIATGTWTALPNMPTAVFGATGGFVGGKFCVAGGYTTTSGDWGGTTAFQCYDPATNAWAAGPSIPTSIGGAGGSAGGVVDGLLHVTGGCNANTCSSNQHWVYDPASNAWSQAAVLPDYLVFHGAAAGQGKLFVGGDYPGNTNFYEYDTVNDTWIPRASLPNTAGQKSPVGAVAPGGGVFWWGGDLGAWSGVQNSTWYYDPVVDGWVKFTAVMHQATTGAGGGLANDRLWNFGGSTGAGPITPPPHESLWYCVPPSPGAGKLIGHVYDANTGLGVANANVYLEGITNPDFWAERRSGVDGGYSFDPLLANSYYLHVMGMDYFDQYYIGPITVTEGVTTVMDIYLAASDPALSDNAVSITLPPDSSGSYNLQLTNNGAGDLYWHVSEVPADGAYQPPLASMPRGVDAQVLNDLAVSSDGTARFIVYMAEQADLSKAFRIADWSARGKYVLGALRTTARRTQAGLLADLDRAGVTYESRYIVNAVVVRGNRALVDSIIARPEVAYIGPDTVVRGPDPIIEDAAPDNSPTAIEWNIQKIKANNVWSEFGVTGQGIVVSNIDTGVQYDHPGLVQQYRGNLGGGNFDHNYNWWDPYGVYPTAPADSGQHGTHTMGTIVGSDNPTNPGSATNAVGVAPGAQWIACMGLKGSSGYDAELLECAEFILAPWDLNGNNPDPDKRADVVNNSWGGGPAQWWYMQAIYAWRAAGIFVGFSGGNSGPGCNTVHSPSDTYNVLSTGATDINDVIGAFSSRGPADITGIMKPEVSAPGVNIRSTIPGSAYQGGWNGTSMASPHTCGEAALIWSAQPELRGNVQQTYWLIEQSAKPITTTQGCGGDGPNDVPNNVYGWGRIDAYKAVSMALNSSWNIAWLGVEPISGTLAPSDVTTITVSFDSTGLTMGEYTGTLKFEFNDPYIHEVLVPVTLTVGALPQVTFVYHDLEDVVQPGERVWLVGDLTGWLNNPVTMTANAEYSVFTATVDVANGSYGYKYYMPDLPNWSNYDMLNTANRNVTVVGNATVHDYRKVDVGWAHLGDPTVVTVTLGENSGNLVGEVYIQNVTDPTGQGRGVKAQLGYGSGSGPWTWVEMSPTGYNGNNTLFAAVITPTAVGVYTYGVRFDGNWGAGNPNAGWTEGDRLGKLIVQPVPIYYTLTVATAGTGGGIVTPTVGIHSYPVGTVVWLTATPNVGSGFAGWSGDVSGMTNPISVTMDADKVVTATFNALVPPTYTLTVVITPTGSGAVTLEPSGGVYQVGTVVTLTAVPNTGWTFVGWSGDVTGTTNPVTVTMTANKTVTATFKRVYHLYLPVVMKNH